MASRSVSAFLLVLVCSIVVVAGAELSHSARTTVVLPTSGARQPWVGLPENPPDSTSNIVDVRGGARKKKPCDDATGVIFTKTLITAAMETLGLVGVLWAGVDLSGRVESGLFANVITFVSLWIVAFNASFVSSLLGSAVSLTAANKQVLEPNVTPSADWYKKVKKPFWNPPGWLFPIMWLIVSKPTQMAAVYTLLESTDKTPWVLLYSYCAHLSLGDAWNNVFFGCQRIGLGLVVISMFYINLLSTAYLFYRENKVSGYFMLPTSAWVTVATALNLSIYMLNKTPDPKKKKNGKKNNNNKNKKKGKK